MARERLYLFDTTLRDGAQMNGVDFTLHDKLVVAEMLDKLGLDYVEGGYPGANPTDTKLFAKKPALQRAGAPGLPAPERSGPHTTAPCHPAALVAGDAAQRWLLALLAWRDGLDEAIVENRDAEPQAPTALAPPARRRLARWLRSIDADSRRFAQLDDAARHAMRRRAKRLRYASEFVGPLFAGRKMRRLLARLQAALRVLGEWNDLSMAARRYRGGPQAGARGWFAAGWIAARRDVLAAQAADARSLLAKGHPFGKR